MNERFATLNGLVSHYSPSGQEGKAVEWLVNRMASLGFGSAFRDKAGNAVGVMGDGSRQVVLLGHIDTVVGEIPVRVEKGNLRGRGTVDAKGALAAFVDAVALVDQAAGWQFVVIGCVDEERDSTGARFVIPHYRPDFVIVGEPSRWDRLTLGYKGSAWADVTVRRSQSHSASQEESACEAAIALWEAIRAWAVDFNTDRERVFDQVLPTLRGLSSGGDGFQDWARLHVGVRLPLDFPPVNWYSRLAELAVGAQVEPVGFAVPAFQGQKNNPLVRAFLIAIRAESGTPGFVLKSGTSDLNVVAPAWDCPAVAYGPGDSYLDHTTDEHLSLDEYIRSIKVLQGVLRYLTASL